MIEARKRELALDLRRRQALHPLLEHEALDLAPVRVRLRPHDEDLRDRRVGDPVLRPRDRIAALDLLRPGDHRPRVRAVVRLGQPEAADPLAAGELRQVLRPLRVGAVGEDRMHHQGRLHAHGAAIARVDPLHLPRDQPVGDVVDPRPAELLRDRRPEQPQRPHLAHDLPVEDLVPVRLEDARRPGGPGHSPARCRGSSAPPRVSSSSSRKGSSQTKLAGLARAVSGVIAWVIGFLRLDSGARGFGRCPSASPP